MAATGVRIEIEKGKCRGEIKELRFSMPLWIGCGIAGHFFGKLGGIADLDQVKAQLFCRALWEIQSVWSACAYQSDCFLEGWHIGIYSPDDGRYESRQERHIRYIWGEKGKAAELTSDGMSPKGQKVITILRSH